MIQYVTMLIKSYIILGDIYTTKENLFMFQVFVDSAANLPAVTAKKYDIHVVSFVNLVNGKELVCFDPDLSPEEELAKGKEYYNAMRTGCEIKTGLISTANFADAFRTALEADQDVIYLSLSKNISGTYNSARLAAEELLEEYGGKRKIRLVDSLNASLAQGILAIYASEMRDRGMNVDEAADLLETYVGKMNGVFTVGDLKYLSRTGRIKGSVAVVGNMLKIKPILRGSEDGYIVSYKNVRGRKAVLNELIRLFCETIEEPEKQIVGIAHADAYEESLYMMEEIQKRVKVREFINTSYDYCTGSHVGPETVTENFRKANALQQLNCCRATITAPEAMSDRIRSLCSISEKTAVFCKRSNQTNHCCSTVFFPKLL